MKVKPFFFCFSHRNNQSVSVDTRGYENYCDGLKVACFCTSPCDPT